MRFAVQPGVMNSSGAVLDALNAIVARAEDEVHEVEIVQADLLQESEWYKYSHPDRKKSLERIAITTFYRPPRTRGPHLRRVEVSNEASATRAKNIAHAPLLVLAENDISDGALIEVALRTFAATATTELCFGAPSKLDPPAFQIESRGGHGELPKLITKRVEDAKTRQRPHRLVVVTDSDGEWSGDVKKHAVTIRELCTKHNVPCPPLHKRTVENYIPDAFWIDWITDRSRTNIKPAVEALLRLSPEQRDFVDMGCPSKSLDCDTTEVEALFKIVSDDDRSRLHGPNANLKGAKDAMTILALKGSTRAFTPADLKARDHQGDLLALVRHIEDEL